MIEKTDKEKSQSDNLGVEIVRDILSSHISWYAFFWTFTTTVAVAIGYAYYNTDNTNIKIPKLILFFTFLLLTLTSLLSFIWAFIATLKLPNLVFLSGIDAKNEYSTILRWAFILMSSSLFSLLVLLVSSLYYSMYNP